MKYVIVGGGIAGVNCALEVLRSTTSQEIQVILISASSHVKTVTNWHKIGQFTENFEISLTNEPLTTDPRFTMIFDEGIEWNSSQKFVITRNCQKMYFDKLCIATGASPICPWPLKKVKRIRDTESALELQEMLKNCNNLVIVGNGGIATELVYYFNLQKSVYFFYRFELKNTKITWLIRGKSVSSSFFPEDVENFILPKLLEGRNEGSKNKKILKRLQYSTSGPSTSTTGAALGPDWCTVLDFGAGDSRTDPVKVIENSEVVSIRESAENVIVDFVRDEKCEQIICDFVIWATGVTANSKVWAHEKNLKLAENGGILVDDIFRTSIPDVFSCGDVCTLDTQYCSKLFKQMHLWTQARQTSEICAKSMVLGEEAHMYNISLELFTHCTTFFGMKVVFIGDYKPEKQEESSWKVVERIIGDTEYVRCILVNHKMVGALLIGETNLEETMENMIMNETNLEEVEDTFLDPGVEIDDFFD